MCECENYARFILGVCAMSNFKIDIINYLKVSFKGRG